ncbi:hypothetical protein CVV68_11065 [Arthrobacter livingstonensis]|uniref:WXG100 family type VII secretion target n=1 Tax=Arthrobacter livingstonensis TaxID=670078 RepID=A0A2V5LJI1_9MICC|nr:hypothetical protein [Arthrobacter livingstonensis]PYI67270.1 hypothetical protein CVV68_11065 [Arthrobacter livingstonensis]
MNDQMLGADPAQLRELATLFSTSSDQLDRTVQLLHPVILHARWQGADASRFRADWSGGMRPQMTRARDFLRTTANALLTQAGEQESASAVDGGGGRGKPLPGGTPDDQSDLEVQLDSMRDASKEDVAAWWNSLSAVERNLLLNGQDANKVPLALQLAALEGKLPADARQAANDVLVKNAKASIPMYSSKEKFGIDGQLAWVHGGAHIGTDITQNADGSAMLKVSGDIGGGVNTPGTKGGANATLTGELSRSYKFKSLADAQAALNQMTQDLPPDDLGAAKDAISSPVGYLMGTLDHAAGQHGAVNHFDSAKGTISAGIDGKLSADVHGSAKLEMAYEQNLSDGSSTATATAKADAKLDLGDGQKLSGNGEAGIKLSMNDDHSIQKLTLSVKGTLESSVEVREDAAGTLAGQKDGMGATGGAGVQGSVQMEIYNTPANEELIKSYLANSASGDPMAAGADLARIYHASGVTVQANVVSSAEANLVDFDSGVASLKVGSTSEVTTNASTGYKAPHGTDYEPITMK